VALWTIAAATTSFALGKSGALRDAQGRLGRLRQLAEPLVRLYDLAVLFLLLPVLLAELGLRPLRVGFADEVVVLRRLALDRRSAPLVLAALAWLPGHGCPPRLGKM